MVNVDLKCNKENFEKIFVCFFGFLFILLLNIVNVKVILLF